MPHKQFIHADEDVESVLRFADSIGLLLLPDILEDKNARPRKPEELRAFSRGTIYLFRPEWVMDDIQMRLIDGGADVGKYSVPPSTNFSPVELSFSGEKDIAGIRRLGIGNISFKRDWFHYKAHEIRLSPPEVEPMYKQVCKQLLSKIFVKGGVHRYYVCKQAAKVAARCETLPPFDYIPWPPPDLNVQRTSALAAAVEKKSVTIETPSGEITFKEGTLLDQKGFNDTVTELTRDEFIALECDIKRVPAFIAAFVSPEDRTGDTLEDLDLAFAAWLESRQRDVFTSADVIRIVGCAVGAHSIQHLGVRWARVTDAYGSSIALVAEQPPTRAHPFNSVLYRIEDNKTDFIVALFRSLEHNMKSASK